MSIFIAVLTALLAALGIYFIISYARLYEKIDQLKVDGYNTRSWLTKRINDLTETVDDLKNDHFSRKAEALQKETKLSYDLCRTVLKYTNNYKFALKLLQEKADE